MKSTYKRIIYAVIIFVLAVFTIMIINTNRIYHRYMKVVQKQYDEWYEGDGYSIRVDRYEVCDMQELEGKVVDKEQFTMYQKVFETQGKEVLVYATVKVNDKKIMKKDWWAYMILNADNAWRNGIDIYMLSMIDGTNLSLDNYEDGKEYSIIIPYEINVAQITKNEYSNAENWKYSIIYSQNPVVYANLKNK